MDDEQLSYSRLSRYQKKRKNTRWLMIFVGIGSVLIVMLVIALVMSGSDDEPAIAEPDQEVPNEGLDDGNDLDGENGGLDDDPEPIDDLSDSGDETDEDAVPVEQNPDDFALETLSSDDENVMYAYTSTWGPIPTVQEEPHEITWEQSSVDWKEMMKAAELATGINVDEMYYLWVSGNGPQSVIATFSNSSMDEHFRVYITWVEGQGWMPERVDVLYTHDEMDRFGSNTVEDEVDGDVE
ncbi:YrrS family protein [Amphibacillus indicireducens]|uniref:DUF1510 domain-containing protein n=1 Tax=Amphibacillus indicireducens TaxID=1076330 RepID=A0ABP7VTV8_9BACI